MNCSQVAFCNLNVNWACTIDGKEVFGGPCPPDGHDGRSQERKKCRACIAHTGVELSGLWQGLPYM